MRGSRRLLGESEEGSQFLVVIVQPFVLAQRVEDVRTEGGAEA